MERMQHTRVVSDLRRKCLQIIRLICVVWLICRVRYVTLQTFVFFQLYFLNCMHKLSYQSSFDEDNVGQCNCRPSSKKHNCMTILSLYAW